MNARRHRIPLALATCSLLSGVAAAQDSRETLLGHGVFRIDQQVFGFELLVQKNGAFDRLTSFVLGLPAGATRPETETRRSEPTPLWIGRRPALDPGASMSFAQRADGLWVLAGSYSKGGGRGLRYWSGLRDPRETPPDDDVRVRMLYGLALVKSEKAVVDETMVPPSSRLDDIWDPQLLERGGRFHVIASGYSLEAQSDIRDGWIIAAARLPIRDEHLELNGGQPTKPGAPRFLFLVANELSRGTDPRVARMDDTYIVSVRNASFSAKGAVPLQFVESTDLESWKIDGEIVSVQAEPAYAIAVRHGRVWMASAKSDKDRCSIVLHRHAPETGTWVQERSFDVGAPLDYWRTPQPYVWLFGADDEPGPVVVFRNQKGELKVLR